MELKHNPSILIVAFQKRNKLCKIWCPLICIQIRPSKTGKTAPQKSPRATRTITRISGLADNRGGQIHDPCRQPRRLWQLLCSKHPQTIAYSIHWPTSCNRSHTSWFVQQVAATDVASMRLRINTKGKDTTILSPQHVVSCSVTNQVSHLACLPARPPTDNSTDQLPVLRLPAARSPTDDSTCARASAGLLGRLPLFGCQARSRDGVRAPS